MVSYGFFWFLMVPLGSLGSRRAPYGSFFKDSIDFIRVS